MIRSLQLTNYRGFHNFELHDLGRVNLIVGTNNAGKTSVLEAVHILQGTGEFGPFWSTLTRRGEDLDERETSNVVRQVEIRRLFHGHKVTVGSSFEITARTDNGPNRVTARIVEASPDMKGREPTLFDSFEGAGESEFLTQAATLGIRWVKAQTGEDISAELDLTRRGGVARNEMRKLNRVIDDTHRVPILFITAASLSPDIVIDLFEEIVLTPYEDFVIEALRSIEPSLERIATSRTERRSSFTRMDFRGGLIVKCRGIRDRIPIGSMGDGIWRILSLALALARAEGGIVLVDEIDTGLHYSVMESMWKLVSQTAKRLNVQVFATSHSRDCYESLAAISRESVSKQSEITIQRIERGKERSVAYSEQEIIAAARRHLEVR
jgi:predicted ATPase